jgi:hypothetical protein
VNEVIETLSNTHLFLGFCLDIVFDPDDLTEVLVHLLPRLDRSFITPTNHLLQELLPQWLKSYLKILDLLIELTYLPKQRISLWRDHVQSMNEIVHEAHLLLS